MTVIEFRLGDILCVVGAFVLVLFPATVAIGLGAGVTWAWLYARETWKANKGEKR